MTIPDTWRTGRVAIVMMSAVGDTVHALPVVTALKRHAPGCHLTWILQPGPASLVRGHPAVDEFVVFEKARGWRAYADARRRLREPFDLVLDLQVYIKAGLMTALLRSPVKLGFDRARARDLNWLFTTHRIPPHAPQHVQDQYFEFLRYLGVPSEPVVWDLGPWPHEREAQRRFFGAITGPVVTLAIGTSDPEREWPAARWAELSDALVERYGLQPVLAGGGSPRERETERDIAALARHRPRSTLGAPLRDLVWLLDGSALVVALDSAPTHLAVALDRPVIALCGAWNPKRTGPYRSRDLLVDAYGDPGEDYPISIARRTGRMGRLQVADVLERVERWRARTPPPGLQVTAPAAGVFDLRGAADRAAPRVCLVMLSALGDVVHALPVITAIKRHVPATRLTWILQPGPATLVRGHPDVDEILIFERRRGWPAMLELRRELRNRPFDLVIDLQPYFKAGLITGFTRAPVKLGLDRARARDLNWLFTTHRIPPRPLGRIQEQFLEFLDAIGVPRGVPAWGLRVTAEERAAARGLSAGAAGPLVGLVVATSKPRKNWMPERYAQLAGRLRDVHGARCVLLGDTTPLERAAADAISAGTDAAPIDALGCGLRTTVALLEACDVVVAPDTGPVHICVAMDVPAVALFGYTNPRRFGPSPRFGDLLVDAFGDPGETYTAAARYRDGRMERITVEAVAAKVALALERYGGGAPWRRATLR